MIQVVSLPYSEGNPESKYTCTVQMDSPDEIKAVRSCLCDKKARVTNPYKLCKTHKYISRIIFTSRTAKKDFVARLAQAQ